MNHWEEWAMTAKRLWPSRMQRVQIAGEYAQLSRSPQMLADLCKRNHVFGPAPDVDSLYQAGIAEGRRRAVLELLALSRINPQELSKQVSIAPAERRNVA